MKEVIVRKRGESEKSIKIGEIPIHLLARTDHLEGMIVELPPESEIPKVYSHPGEEIRIVLEGTIEVERDGEKYLLEKGDVMWHQSTMHHKIKNPTKKKAVYFSVNLPPSLEW